MYEVEVPILVNIDTIHNKLSKLGAKLKGNIKRVKIMYSKQMGDLSFSKGQRELRIELLEDRTILTFKVYDNLHEREEKELEISDPEVMHSIILALGFHVRGVNKEERWFYKYKDFNLDVKHVIGLGDFLEVERMVRDKKSIPKARKEINQFIEMMGFKPLKDEELIRMCNEYNKKGKFTDKVDFGQLKRYLSI